MATPDEILAALTVQLNAKAQEAANIATARAMRMIDAKAAETVNKARDAVIASGLIGGVLGAVLVLVLQKVWKKVKG
jgi:hypothetical protein